MGRTDPRTAAMLRAAGVRGRVAQASASALVQCIFHRAAERPLTQAMVIEQTMRAVAKTLRVVIDEKALPTVQDPEPLGLRVRDLAHLVRTLCAQDDDVMGHLRQAYEACYDVEQDGGLDDEDDIEGVDGKPTPA